MTDTELKKLIFNRFSWKKERGEVCEITDFRDDDDNRLPDSLLSLDEFREAVKICNKCTEEKSKLEVTKKLPLRSPLHPYNKVFEFLNDIHLRYIGTEFEHACVLCGASLDNSRPSKYQFPICLHCEKRLVYGKIRGTDVTKGFKYYKKRCIICGVAYADPNRKGMCKSCYRIGEIIKASNAKKRKGTDGKVVRGTLNSSSTHVDAVNTIGEQTPNNTTSSININSNHTPTLFVRKKWAEVDSQEKKDYET